MYTCIRKWKADYLNPIRYAQNNGKNGTQTLIAYNGNVYDVTKSYSWEDGNHENLHDAGKDLTEDLETAPHGEDLLDKFSIIGTLKN